jgi:hypothetical protein
MKVSELTANTAVPDMELRILELGEQKTTNCGFVQSASARDDTGTVNLSLWGEHVGIFKAGDVVKLTKGWCKEYRGQLQVSAGKFGKLEKTGEAPPATPAAKPLPRGQPAKAGIPTGAIDELTGRPILERIVCGNHLRPSVSGLRGQWKKETYVGVGC